jgi:hypothetical protein
MVIMAAEVSTDLFEVMTGHTVEVTLETCHECPFYMSCVAIAMNSIVALQLTFVFAWYMRGTPCEIWEISHR